MQDKYIEMNIKYTSKRNYSNSINNNNNSNVNTWGNCVKHDIGKKWINKSSRRNS